MTRMLERILIVEDELPMRTVLGDCLSRQGYRVLSAPDGEQGLAMALGQKPDLIVLDIMMPKVDGFALCRELRRLEQTTPILILTARNRVEDRVAGLDMGADDFLAKPFSREEFLARVRALLRRLKRNEPRLGSMEIGRLTVDFIRLAATRGGQPIHLTPKEFSMLRLLVEHEETPVSRERFLDLVWGWSAFPTTRTVDKHVANLRAKIEPNPDQPSHLKTLHGVGYVLRLRPSESDMSGAEQAD
jgi:DNA-binding response OmpR family regulator